jgi:hypothetical protein
MYMLYLIDESDQQTTRPPVAHDPAHRGVLTWQQLAGLQISLTQQLELPSIYRQFIAGAIQYQFCQHRIRPSVLLRLDDDHGLIAPTTEAEDDVEAVD